MCARPKRIASPAANGRNIRKPSTLMVVAAEPRPAPLHQEQQRDQDRAREGQAQAPHQEDGDARHDELADDDRATDDRHRGGELEAGAEVTRARGVYVLRLTWSASLQKAQTVPVVTWPQRAHSRSSTASARSNAARALSRKPNRKLCFAPGETSSIRLRISL